ncbi:MAG TPA: PTS lactose/cellobiose transporter subunit IIA [Candidatus Coprousia avicola]|nr:PTS lactose/cellobiose transporter subunit IIA [Candidatus Coprousia avicola]
MAGEIKDAVEDQEQLELSCFQLVALVGNARSCYLEAIDLAEAGDFEAARVKLDEGDASFHEGHDAHMQLLTREANGEQLPFRIIVLHAEDQLMSAEAFRIIAERFIKVYETMNMEEE